MEPPPPIEPPKPPTVVVIDPVHTQQAIARMGDDALSALSLQQQKLQRMQVGCVPQAGQACVSLSQNFAGRGGNTDATVGLNLAYGFGGNFSAGLALDHSLQRDLPGSHKDRRNNAGMGVFARWQQKPDGNGWFIHPAAAFESYKLQLRRPTNLPNTEAGEGQSQVQGTAYSLTTGQNFALGGGRQFGWYAAVRHSDLRRDAYAESNDVAFPVSYGDLRLRDTSTAVGARAAIPLGSQLLWRASAEVEQHVAGSNPVYTAGAQYVGGYSRELEVKKTRASVSTGLSYRLGPLFSVSLDAQAGNGLFGKSHWGTSLKLTGQF
ncbi:MAG: autotransporter outer membrane beta-barrel domain-containing protein [Brachymonas sp.]|nr:autotransporter outer membrane beta-barrel domain-containing protein [Brachymonas sp.]